MAATAAAMRFKDRAFEERQEESARIRERFPDRLPVIVERATNRGAAAVPELDKSKFLVPVDLTVGQFVYVLRRRLSLPADQALFLFVHSTLPPSTALMRDVYAAHRDADGFLYVSYSGESSFGA